MTDLKRSVDFYAQHLGLTVKQDWGNIVFLGDERRFDLALVPDEAPGEMPSWFHFGCRLEDADVVGAAHDRMRAEGVTIEAPYAVDGDYVRFVALVPDGYGIEIYFDPALA